MRRRGAWILDLLECHKFFLNIWFLAQDILRLLVKAFDLLPNSVASPRICKRLHRGSYAVGYFDLLKLDFTAEFAVIYRRAFHALFVAIEGERRCLHLHVRRVESLHIGHFQMIDLVHAGFVLAIQTLGVVILNVHTLILLSDLKRIEFFDIITIVVLYVNLGIHVLQRIIPLLFLT